MFERVLFPTDFSVYANTVATCLPFLQAAGVKEVVLLHVIRASDVPLPETYNLESYKFIRWSVEEQLHLLKMAIEGPGLRVRTRIEYGSPVMEVIRVAREECAELIIIGAQGTTLTQELMIGSTAFEVVRRSPIPTLLVKAEVIQMEGHNRCRIACAKMFQRVMHPTDFSAFADEAYNMIKKLHIVGTREVILLHVQDDRVMKHRTQEQLSFFDREDQNRLETRCQELLGLGFKARWLLRHGNTVQQTLKVADEQKVGLIVMGSQGRSAIKELVAGSTLENVIRLAKQPVLVVRSLDPPKSQR